MSKEIQPTDVRDIVYKGEVARTDSNEDIEEINKRAEDSVSDYEFGPKWLPGKNVAGDSGGSSG